MSNLTRGRSTPHPTASSYNFAALSQLVYLNILKSAIFRCCPLHALLQPVDASGIMSSPYLPVELCTQIFEHFQLTSRDIATTDIESRRREDFIKLHTLRNICLVSKSFHRIAWPILYRVFPFTSDLLQYGKCATNHGESRDELYLQTLYRIPAYADALRFIYMDVSRPKNEYCRPPSVPPASAYHVDGSCYVLQPGSRLRRFQGTETKQGMYEYFLALVLIMCRNVQGLHLTTPNCEDPDSSLLDEALTLAYVDLPSICTSSSESKAGKQQILRRLRTITVAFEGFCPDASFQCRNHSWLLRALQSASLETLTLRRMHWNLFGDDGNVVASPRPLIEVQLMHLTTLRLLKYGAGGSLVGSLVKSCPSLTVLEVVWSSSSYSNDYYNDEYELIAFDLIAAAIASHCPNLSTLVLDDSEQRWYGYAMAQHTFGRRLSAMQRLRNVSVSEYAFYTDEGEERILEALPQSLESLRIISSKYHQAARGDTEWNRAIRARYDADTRLILLDKSLPLLKHVVLDHHSYYNMSLIRSGDPYHYADSESLADQEPRDIYNDDAARNGWKLCEDGGDAAQTLVRSSVNVEDVDDP